ncbi:MAG TPA: hypothetical protein VGO61_06735 [Steroidobacteraceae bacterium]|jgi:hypothetical protein|nr:hypothetical protein [Steroidobacteraceae bacterium]
MKSRNSHEHFEDELRRRLRPVDAPDGFTERLMRALPADAKPAPVIASIAPTRAPSRMRQFGMPAALAASLLVAVLLGQHVAVQHQQLAEQQGRAASLELMQALRLTSQKLDIAYQAVQSPPPAAAEENRS